MLFNWSHDYNDSYWSRSQSITERNGTYRDRLLRVIVRDGVWTFTESIFIVLERGRVFPTITNTFASLATPIFEHIDSGGRNSASSLQSGLGGKSRKCYFGCQSANTTTTVPGIGEGTRSECTIALAGIGPSSRWIISLFATFTSLAPFV
jgi:hypothetical protein